MALGSCPLLSYHHHYSMTCQEKDLYYFDMRNISSREKESCLHPLFDNSHRKADLLVRSAYSFTTKCEHLVHRGVRPFHQVAAVR